MTDRGTNDGMEDQVAAYVLDALEPAEASAVRAHLASCATCRELERRLRRVTELVPLAAEEATPPPRLRDRVLAAAGASSPAPPRPRRAASTPGLRSRRRRWPRPLELALAATLVVLLALAAWNVSLNRQLHQARTGPLTTVVRSPITATSANTIAGASGQVIQLRSQGLTIVNLQGLPALAEGQVYELWVGPSAKHVEPAGVFLPEQDGSKVLLLDHDLTHDSLIAVTIEPGPSGTSAPTQAPGLSGKL